MQMAADRVSGALETALARERVQGMQYTAQLRVVASVSFLGLVTLLSVLTGSASWQVMVPPVAGHALIATGVWFLRHHRAAPRLALLSAASDVALVYLAQSTTLPLSPFPAGVAGFSLGLFALLVALNALTLQRDVVAVSAALSIMAQLRLMQQAGVGWGAQFSAAIVILLMAWACVTSGRRVRALVAGIATAEVERLLEQRRSEERETARATIARLLEEARVRNAELERLQSDLETWTQLLVHDLRSPLTVILGNADLVRTRLEGRPDMASNVASLESMVITTERMNAMIGALLDTPRLEQGTLRLVPAPVDLKRLISEVARETARLAPKRAHVVTVDAPGPVSLQADGALLRRVLENLAFNASRYTLQGERIEFSLRVHEAECAIAVRNDGSPLSEETRRNLFQKFSKGRESAGWGLGLYFCRLVVEAHRGRIALEDEEGWPVSFVVRLPVVPSPPRS